MKLLSVRCERGEGIRLLFLKIWVGSRGAKIRRRREFFDVGEIFWLVAGKRL